MAGFFCIPCVKLGTMTTFADITTIAVGGRIARFIEPDSRVGVIEAVEDADTQGLPLFVIGGGSNTLAGDADFEGVVVRDARRAVSVPDEVAPVENGLTVAHVNAEAGVNWDDFVEFTVRLGLAGVEGLSGIPGTVGASVVQNIGAYGQEVAGSVESVEVWDRQDKCVRELSASELGFGYRTSALKRSMLDTAESGGALGTGTPNAWFPTPRHIVLSVTFALRHAAEDTVAHSQLAHALGVETGDSMPIVSIREAVLRVRASKGMLEDPTRYALPAMAGAKREENVLADLKRLASLDAPLNPGLDADGLPNPVSDRHSCGSFFMNPVLTPEAAATLPDDAPRFAAALPDGTPGVKTSAAWLIDHAGFHKGFRVAPDSPAGLSTLHTLALTNRGGASAADVQTLARTIQAGVREAFGVSLVPEPVVL